MPREKGKREAILEAASRIFGSKGYYKANIIDIAQEAGIGKGTIYEYFENKSSLFIETIKYNADKYSRRMKQQIDSHACFEQKLRSFVNNHRNIIRENIKSAAILFINPADLNLNDESLKKVIDFLCDVREKTAGLLAEILEQGRREGLVRDLDVEFAADMLLEMLSRCCMRGVLLNQSDRQMQLENEMLIDLFMNGARKTCLDTNWSA